VFPITKYTFLPIVFLLHCDNFKIRQLKDKITSTYPVRKNGQGKGNYIISKQAAISFFISVAIGNGGNPSPSGPGWFCP